MATKKNNAPKGNGSAKAAKSDDENVFSDLPEGFDTGGFDDMSRPEIDGWYSPEMHPGTVAGTVVGRIEVADEDGDLRDVILLETAVPVTASVDKEPTLLPVGSVLGVGMRMDLKILLSYVEHKGKAIFKPIEKIKIKGGRTKWKFAISCKGQKSAPPTPTPAQQGTSNGYIPF